VGTALKQTKLCAYIWHLIHHVFLRTLPRLYLCFGYTPKNISFPPIQTAPDADPKQTPANGTVSLYPGFEELSGILSIKGGCA
jgi:hypothetical protein